MLPPARPPRSVSLSAALALSLASAAGAAVQEFGIFKTRAFEQQSPAPPDAADFVFHAFIDMDPGDASIATLNGSPFQERLPGLWIFEMSFPNQASLDIFFPSGDDYDLVYTGGSQGTQMETITFPTGDNYPAPPAITTATFNALQDTQPGQSAQIEWYPPPSGTSRVTFRLTDVTHGDELLIEDRVPPAQTSAQIPGALLEPDTQYRVEIEFADADTGTGSPPPGFGTSADRITGYASATGFTFIPGQGLPCSADLNGDGVLSFFDVSAFADAFVALDPIADYTGDGAFTFFDVSAFIVAYSAGCP